MDEQTRIEICGLIAGMLSSDQGMDVHEAAFLQRVRKNFGVPKGAAVQPIVDRDQAVAKLLGFSEQAREETLELLIKAAAADGKVAPEERGYLEVIAGSLQIGADELDDRLQQQLVLSKPQPFGPDTSSDD
jgi:uncharacterized tellurite resistance protein B-like protein